MKYFKWLSYSYLSETITVATFFETLRDDKLDAVGLCDVRDAGVVGRVRPLDV